jgi:hypothetical protein
MINNVCNIQGLSYSTHRGILIKYLSRSLIAAKFVHWLHDEQKQNWLSVHTDMAVNANRDRKCQRNPVSKVEDPVKGGDLRILSVFKLFHR